MLRTPPVRNVLLHAGTRSRSGAAPATAAAGASSAAAAESAPTAAAHFLAPRATPTAGSAGKRAKAPKKDTAQATLSGGRKRKSVTFDQEDAENDCGE